MNRKVSLAVIYLGTLFSGFLLHKGIQLLFSDAPIFESKTFITTYTFWGRSFEFLAGMSLSTLLSSKLKAQSPLPGRLRAINTAIGALGIVTVIVALQALALSENQQFGIQTFYGLTIHHWILPVFTAILIRGLCTEESSISRILGSRFFILLGKSSYAFYLIQQGLIADFIKEQTHSLFLLFIGISATSIALYKFIEEPANRYIRKI